MKNTCETKMPGVAGLTFGSRLRKDLRRHYGAYLLMIPVIVYYIIFYYKPMYGALIAFQDYDPVLGIWRSPWVGFAHFKRFFSSPDCYRVIKNTLVLSLNSIIWGFPAPIILAIMMNEIKGKRFKSAAQTISYLPHFISLVVVCGLIKTFVSSGGIILQFYTMLGGKNVGMLNRSEMFVPIYILSDIWQGCGWNSIIYLAAISGISADLYEAATIDGAGRWKKIIHVTIPGIIPTVITMLILRLGSLMSIGYEKVILLYNPLIYETSDIIGSFTYRTGIGGQQWSYSSALGIFNSVINMVIVIAANYISAKVTETSLW